MFIINNTVAQIRNKRNITQEVLAEASGVSRQTIIALERGNYVPSLLLALRISNFFSLPIENIFVLEESDLQKNIL